ncbi:DUF2243 domain-containing protein [Bordetella genomosp. 7]|uniref:DUF2243 domain-containing protein n=1 Tax=Bordetella genomosp. 7 TaxID=1416805 RepID=A0A261RD31_9BORD|nr:DUF2243 domain-containing protein [Bordetella genomosp. 7]OZI22550.1 hypothetical protein CAL19_08465 [Bordetella genomosp. 7]
MKEPAQGHDTAARRSPAWGGYLLGFGMGGFFDGILLHQVLQWHHLLSAYQAGPLGDLRVQVMADGIFHVLMYVVAMAGLWVLYRARRAGPPSRRRLLAAFLVGFGIWHVVDAVLSHWLAGIHRIRMDVPNPLPWDLGWLLVFGLLPLFAGLWLRRRADPPGGGQGGGHGMALLLAAAVVTAAVFNLVPLRKAPADATVVVLRPGAAAAGLFTALDDTGAAIIWADAGGGVWVLHGVPLGQRLSLYGAGAMYVSGGAVPAGCAAWLTPQVAQAPT